MAGRGSHVPGVPPFATWPGKVHSESVGQLWATGRSQAPLRGVPACKAGSFPLDEELELLPGFLTPHLVEAMVQLGSRIPFGQAAELIGWFWRVEVPEATVRRATEKSGQACVEWQREEVEALEKEMEEAPQGPALQQLSVDGAMAPLLHGEWGEVKTMAIGTIG